VKVSMYLLRAIWDKPFIVVVPVLLATAIALTIGMRHRYSEELAWRQACISEGGTLIYERQVNESCLLWKEHRIDRFYF
jgi:hypothetical protein